MTLLDAPASAQRPGTAPGRRTRWRAVWQLTRVEAVRLAKHPLVLVVVPLGLALGLLDLADLRFVLPRESISLQMVAMPIGAAVLIATHLATTRPRRDAVVELLEPAVHGMDTRLLALLAAALVPALMTAVVLGAALAAMAALGAPGPVLWAEAATTPVLVACAGLLGVCTGRLAPWRLTPLFTIVVVFAFQLVMVDYPPTESTTRELLAPIILSSTSIPDPTAVLRPAVAHLIYVAAIGAAFGLVALLATRVSATRAMALGVALALAVGAGVVQVSAPSDDEVQALLARVGSPAASGECVEDGTGAQVCVPAMFRGWQDELVEVVHDVRAPLVERGVELGALTVAQRTDPSTAGFELDRWFEVEEVDVHGQIERAWEVEYGPAPGTVLVTETWLRASASSDPSGLDVAVRVAQDATGMPSAFRALEQHPDGAFEGLRSCTAAGQAREVVALWLAARTSPGAAGALRDALADTSYPATTASGLGRSGGSVEGSLPVYLDTPAVLSVSPRWSPSGADVALQLLESDDDAVLAQVVGDWARWTDPATSLRELVDGFGLTMPPLADDLEVPGVDVGQDGQRLLRATPEPPPIVGDDGLVHIDEADQAGPPIGCP